VRSWRTSHQDVKKTSARPRSAAKANHAGEPIDSHRSTRAKSTAHMTWLVSSGTLFLTTVVMDFFAHFPHLTFIMASMRY
jgi:hypothetical protein